MTTTSSPRSRRGHQASPAPGLPPPPHPVWQRLESPLSTYYLLLGVVAALVAIGLIMVLSASSVRSFSQYQSVFTLFFKQAQFAVVGVVGAVIASRLPAAFWIRVSGPLLGVVMLLLLLVFTPLGVTVNGNRNWLALGPLQMQPAELGKFALVLYGATALTMKRRRLQLWRHALTPLVFPAGVTLLALVLAGRDLGTSLVLLAILGGLLWSAGVSGRLFLLAAGAGAGLVSMLVLISGNRMERINNWLSCDSVYNCWQSRHGQFALADGGLGGLGLGASHEKWLWLPEPHNDFIFAIIGEELGIGGTLLVLALFALLALACYRVVLHTADPFVRVATGGVLVWVVAQAFINVGAVIGLLPVVGVPLPLVSNGGSALVTTLVALGMVISFARSEPACARALAARPHVLRRSLSVLAPQRLRARGRRDPGAATTRKPTR